MVYQDGRMSSKIMARVNKEYYGQVYMMHSRTDSIFMTSDTTLEMFEEAFTPAFRKKRLMLGITNVKEGIGGVYADAFTGNSSTGSGEHMRRREWGIKNSVVLFPCLVGGGSANGAPADAYHAEQRQYQRSFEDCALGYHDDIYKRPDLVSLARGSKGFRRNIDAETQVVGHIWSWLQIKGRTLRWAWLSRGLGTREQMAEWHGLTSAEVEAEYDMEQHRAENPCSLDSLPTVTPPAVDERLHEPLEGEVTRMWVISRFDLPEDGPDDLPADVVWEQMPRFMTLLADKYVAKFNHDLKLLEAKLADLENAAEVSQTMRQAAIEKVEKHKVETLRLSLNIYIRTVLILWVSI